MRQVSANLVEVVRRSSCSAMFTMRTMLFMKLERPAMKLYLIA